MAANQGGAAGANPAEAFHKDLRDLIFRQDKTLAAEAARQDAALQQLAASSKASTDALAARMEQLATMMASMLTMRVQTASEQDNTDSDCGGDGTGTPTTSSPPEAQRPPVGGRTDTDTPSMGGTRGLLSSSPGGTATLSPGRSLAGTFRGMALDLAGGGAGSPPYTLLTALEAKAQLRLDGMVPPAVLLSFLEERQAPPGQAGHGGCAGALPLCRRGGSARAARARAAARASRGLGRS
jgi:hypothetical protein